MILPIQYAVYKGMGGKFGAAQFNLQPAHKYCPKCKKRDFTGEKFECSGSAEQSHDKEKFIAREGTVFVEVTSAKDKNVYDWDKKVVMALSVTDLSKLLYGFRTGCMVPDPANEGQIIAGEVKILHDPGAKTETMGKIQKYITLTSPKGPTKGFMLNASEFGGTDKKMHTVPLNPDEVVVLSSLFQAAISKILGWTA